MIDEERVVDLAKVFPHLKYLEVQGMNMDGNDKVRVLCSPLTEPVAQTQGPVDPTTPMEVA